MKTIHHLVNLVFILSGLSAAASTSVPAGNVSGTWTAAGSPYLILGEIKVPAGSTLTIEPAVTIEFQGHYKFIVEGRLAAQGSPSGHISFTALTPATGWFGLRFQDLNLNPMDTSYLAYCDLSFGIANGSGNDALGGGVFCDNASRIRLSHCTLSNCTATQGAGMYCNNSSPRIDSVTFYLNTSDGLCLNAASTPLVTGCTFQQNGASGLRILATSSKPLVTGCLFLQNDGYPVFAYPDHIGGFATNTFQDNTQQLIYVYGGVMARDAVWTDQGIPFRISGDMSVLGTDGANGVTTLTLEQGVILQFAAQCGLAIGSNTEATFKGGLIAMGIPGDSVVFTGEAATPGAWDGLAMLDYAVDSLLNLDYCVVSYGGYSAEENFRITYCSPVVRNSAIRYGSGNGLHIQYGAPAFYDCEISHNTNYGVNAYTSPVFFKRSTIAYNASYGLYSAFANMVIDSCLVKGNTNFGLYDLGGSDYPVITNDTFVENNGYPVNIHCNALNQFHDNVFSGNAVQRIRVGGGTVVADALWVNAGIPYEISGDVVVAGTSGADGITTLNIAPGTVLRFANLSGLAIGSGSTPGALQATGDPENRVLFTANSDTPAAGYWDGLTFNNASSDNQCRLSNAIIEYAGYSANDGITLVSASPLIENLCARYNDGAGIGCGSSSGPVIRNSVFRDNTLYGIYVSGSNPSVRNNTIENQPNGLYCTGTCNPVVMNNIFCGNTKGISSAPALTNVMYNDFYASSAHFDGTVPAGFGVLNQVNFNGTACDVFQNIFQDPLFVDAPNHDFNLQDGSLCRNAGHPATDTTANHYCYYGNPRFLEDHIDLGAAESGIWWTGAVSPDWNDAGNWSTGSVPTQAQSVTISTLSPQNPQISAPNTTIQRLYIKDGAEVVIPYGAELHLTGE